ncbi:protein phosphatase 1 regulatory subunit 37 [Megalops cyprinoides]|uniref:protein phosphatase 1 regulatory subunit 37 n=1 Tax=Megalops cyprinoides TaxID=118141 RepID=UPI0018640EBB|nr:protein phosphatase 1 regulatory subunit 37 [Megalops cyprinoides]
MTGGKEDNNAELASMSPFPKKCKGEKHVSFPPDEEIVSGFAEHKDALREADSITLMEVISAYKRSCLKHQVEPKSKILEQLQEVTNLTTRARCLDLKGERLDYHVCESLEDILKLVQFDFISLRETELEENGASSLLDMILYYESTTHLDISSNTSIGVSGWKALSHLIQQSGCLWRLDACNMPISEYPAQALSKALLTSRLAVLRLENTCLSGRPLFTLVGTLKGNTALQELSLANNNLNSFQDAMQLGELLKYSSCIKSLDLSNNQISDPGLEEICEGLRVQKFGIRNLVLWNNQITHRSMVHLAKVLPLVTLETLNLGHNELQNDGIQILKEPLIANRSILRLGLAHTKISCEGAVTLAEFVAESAQIQRLDIRKNPVRTGGVMALSLALRINRSLVRVDLDRNLKEEKHFHLSAEGYYGVTLRSSPSCPPRAVLPEPRWTAEPGSFPCPSSWIVRAAEEAPLLGGVWQSLSLSHRPCLPGRHGGEIIGFVVTSSSCQELASALVRDEDITVTGP